MKVFFGLLLIVNVAFGVFQWLLPYDQLFFESRKIPLAEELQLLSEPVEQIVSETEVVAEAEAVTEIEVAAVKTETLMVEDTSNKILCYTIGPFKDKTLALEVSGRYTGKQVDTELKSSLEKEYLGVMVYLGSHKTRNQAKQVADRLASKGIRDYIIINEPPDKLNVLSLGVFGLKKNADRHAARIAKLNYEVKTELRYRERTIYWLYNRQSSESEIQNLLNDTDRQQGISQISSQCV